MVEYIYYLGVFVFAVSGALAAAKINLDWVGALSLSLVTALGGGTFRDLVLNREVFWLEEPMFIWVSIIGSCSTILYINFFKAPKKSLLVFDAIGLAFFTILGAEITSHYYDSIATIALLALFTGVLGGILRDIFSNEVPLLFRSSEPLYSTSALIGVLVYIALGKLSLNTEIVSSLAILTIIVIRLPAVYFNVTLPSLKMKE